MSFSLLDLLFPPRCPFCRKLLPEGVRNLCPDCRRTLPWCDGLPGRTEVSFAAACISPLRYQNEVRTSLLRYKFGGSRAYARPYAALMAERIRVEGWQPDCVCYVPLHRKRLKQRGYDQSRLLAVHLAELLSLPLLPVLHKPLATATQSDLHEDAARRGNVLGAYEVTDPSAVSGRCILLVDDVVTTGSTLSECARVLRTAGAKQVFCVTLAKARS